MFVISCANIDIISDITKFFSKKVLILSKLSTHKFSDF